MSTRDVRLRCPSCGGGARATFNEVTIADQFESVQTTVQKYRCPKHCSLSDDVIIAMEAVGRQL